MKKEVQLNSGIEVLFGTLDENLRLLETTLHISTHLKNGYLEIEGEAADVERMERILEDYVQLVSEGVSFNNGELRGYLKVVAAEPAASLRPLVLSARLRNFGRRSVVPKSLNQRLYM